jgi:hypothetical protein
MKHDHAQIQTTRTRAYYLNTLLAWRDGLLKQRRSLMARYASMKKTGHPDKRDQGYLLEINGVALMNINIALRPLGAAVERQKDDPPAAVEGDAVP